MDAHRVTTPFDRDLPEGTKRATTNINVNIIAIAVTDIIINDDISVTIIIVVVVVVVIIIITKRASAVSVQLLRLQKDLRTGAILRDIVNFPSERCYIVYY